MRVKVDSDRVPEHRLCTTLSQEVFELGDDCPTAVLESDVNRSQRELMLWTQNTCPRKRSRSSPTSSVGTIGRSDATWNQ